MSKVIKISVQPEPGRRDRCQGAPIQSGREATTRCRSVKELFPVRLYCWTCGYLDPVLCRRCRVFIETAVGLKSPVAHCGKSDSDEHLLCFIEELDTDGTLLNPYATLMDWLESGLVLTMNGAETCSVMRVEGAKEEDVWNAAWDVEGAVGHYASQHSSCDMDEDLNHVKVICRRCGPTEFLVCQDDLADVFTALEADHDLHHANTGGRHQIVAIMEVTPCP